MDPGGASGGIIGGLVSGPGPPSGGNRGGPVPGPCTMPTQMSIEHTWINTMHMQLHKVYNAWAVTCYSTTDSMQQAYQ